MPRPASQSAALAFVLLLTLLLPLRTPAQTAERPLYQKDSLYHRIFVTAKDNVISLRFGKRRSALIQSCVDLSDPNRHILEYTTLCLAALLYNDHPRNALILGLGGGVIARALRHHFPDLHIDVVEIDPDILPVAERFFAFRRDDLLRVHIADGRVFVRRLLRRDSPPSYDLVILDAFTSDYIPFHLMTAEFLQEIRGILSPAGVLAANVFYTNRLFDAELATFLHVFGRCDTFVGRTSANAILISTGSAVPELSTAEALRRAENLQRAHDFRFDVSAVAQTLRTDLRPRRGVRFLTDDRAPVNWLRAQEESPSAPIENAPDGAAETSAP